ncbi:MAG: VCBS repeat-containing protein, partial [Bacteroidia bacterium]|nr:VCBS repeat-containing protein [Bacteroidia bacterium]
MKQLFLFFILLGFIQCQFESSSGNKGESQVLFTNIGSEFSGIDFNNEIRETEEINYYKYIYLYNGGGVGIGDINNDGLADVYFSSTMGHDKLYLNKGDFNFEDISDSSGINNYSGHKTGISMTDINNDGWLDIYVCRSGWTKDENDLSNLLFINNKDNTFSELAATYGLNDTSYSVQSVFFDFDNDGDNDMYLSNHPSQFRQLLTEMIGKINQPNKLDSDKLYRNDGNGKFTDVSTQAGILNHGYGLGLAAYDFNNDGWTDIYISNDFAPHDYYYVNQGDGTFKESIKEFFPHCSYFSMGNDVVDINNDGNLDLFVVEMLSEDNVRQKTNMAPMDMDRFAFMVENNLHYQYMRNVFQLNNGNGHFSDIAYFAGIDKTDWSWGTLFGDYDNDGDNDLVVVNGYLRDTQDKDFSNRTNELAKKTNNQLTFDQAYSLLKSTPLNNYAFRYDGDYKFSKVSDEWGFNFSGYSNGVAHGDLDNDG